MYFLDQKVFAKLLIFILKYVQNGSKCYIHSQLMWFLN